MIEIINTVGMIIALLGLTFAFYLISRLHVRVGQIDNNLTKLIRILAIQEKKRKK